MYRLYIQEASTFVLKIFIPIGDKNRYKKTNYDNQFLILFLFLKKKRLKCFINNIDIIYIYIYALIINVCAIMGQRKILYTGNPQKIKDSRNYLSNLNSTKSSLFFLTFIYNFLKYEYFIQNLKKIWFFKGPSIKRIIENYIP